MLYLSLVLLITLVVGEIFQRLKISVVVGELLAGILLSFIITDNRMINIFSEIGVVLLMFLAGIECNLNLLKKTIKSSSIIAVFGTVVPILVAFTICVFFGFTSKQSIFIGIIIAATSVSISVTVLREMQVIDSIEGTAIFDDILSVFLLSFKLSMKLGFQLAYLVFLVIGMGKLIPMIMKYSNKLKLPFSQTIISLSICFILSYPILPKWLGLVQF